MMTMGRSEERGHADHGGPKTYHTISLAEYHDPGHLGFRSRRGINDDKVATRRRFRTNPA
jgi:hypothetical protein